MGEEQRGWEMPCGSFWGDPRMCVLKCKGVGSYGVKRTTISQALWETPTWWEMCHCDTAVASFPSDDLASSEGMLEGYLPAKTWKREYTHMCNLLEWSSSWFVFLLEITKFWVEYWALSIVLNLSEAVLVRWQILNYPKVFVTFITSNSVRGPFRD